MEMIEVGATKTTRGATDDVTLYWIPGCGNCTRLKGYLRTNGIDFNAVNVMEDPDAFETMKRHGIASLPVLRKGDRWESGVDLKHVDALLGLSGGAAGEAKVLGAAELCARVAHVLEVAAQAASVVPKEHHDDPTPTMESFKAPVLFMRDGAPFIPHGTTKSLFVHLTGHGEKFRRLVLAADGTYDMGFKWVADGEEAAFGEVDLATPLYRVVMQAELLAKDIRAWGKAHPDADLSRPEDSHYGVQTTAHLMQAQLCSVVQHARQMLQVVESLGLTPPVRIDPADLDGLQMSPGIWQ